MSQPRDQTFRERDPVELLLRRILRRGLASALLGSVGMLGCADEIETEGTPVACAENGRAELSVAALKPGSSFESLTLRYRRPQADSVSTVQTVSTVGTPCATAAAPAACTAAHMAVPSDPPLGFHVVTTRGDSVETWSGAERLRQLLAPIESAEEAALLVSGAGYDPSCGPRSGVLPLRDGFQTYGTRQTSSCDPIELTRYRLQVSSEGEVDVLDRDVIDRQDGCIGRIPAGLSSVSIPQGQSALGDYLAHCAHLEAASVLAFERLARELTALHAPGVLVARALQSAADEVRHARVVGELAARHGGLPVQPRVETLPLRTLEEVALENATEGCVRETYGALVGGFQAERAEDETLRRAMEVIAEDEARHAALSHHVHEWAMAQLDEPARARVLTAQRAAIVALREECKHEQDAALRRLAGLPSAAMASGLLDELEWALWSDQGRTTNQPARLSGTAASASASSAIEA